MGDYETHCPKCGDPWGRHHGDGHDEPSCPSPTLLEEARRERDTLDQRSSELLDALDQALEKKAPDVRALRGAAFQAFWAWQEVNGHIDRGSSLFGEVEACIEEAFRLGTLATAPAPSSPPAPDITDRAARLHANCGCSIGVTDGDVMRCVDHTYRRGPAFAPPAPATGGVPGSQMRLSSSAHRTEFPNFTFSVAQAPPAPASEAEADRDRLRDLIDTWINTRARIGARVTFADQALRDGFRSWRVGKLVPHGS